MDHYNLYVTGPPTTDWDKVLSKAVEPAVAKANDQRDFEISVLKSDASLTGVLFDRELRGNLERADFCLCDVTALDPNVMYEIGYLRRRESKIIVVRQPGVDLPADIADKNPIEYSLEDLQKLSSFLEAALSKAVSGVKTKRTSDRPSYTVTCFQDRKSSDLGESIRRAEECVNILETNVVTVIDGYGVDLKRALESNPALKVRVLTLDPDSSFVNNRAGQLGVPVGQYRRELHDAIRRLRATFENYGDRFRLRIYNDFPTQIMFRVDETIYSCSIARGKRSRELCTFRLRTDDPGAERSYEFHFEAVWAIGEVYVSP